MSITSVTANGFGKFIKWKPVQKCCNYFEKNTDKAIAYATLASLVGKDGIGCYLYVTQSLNNKKIPDDKRRFVASMDLANGILMMISQVGFFFAMKKFSKPLFDKLFQKSFGKEAFKNLATKLRRLIKAEQPKVAGQSGPGKVPRKPELKKEHSKLEKTCYDAFKNFVTIIASTILAKRVFVPFVSTPLAQYITNRHDEKAAKKTGVAQPEEQPQQAKTQNVPFTQMNKNKFIG